MENKIYLGDGVYASLNDNDQLTLTTENGISATNTIYLEYEVILKLLNFLAKNRLSIE